MVGSAEGHTALVRHRSHLIRRISTTSDRSLLGVGMISKTYVCFVENVTAYAAIITIAE